MLFAVELRSRRFASGSKAAVRATSALSPLHLNEQTCFSAAERSVQCQEVLAGTGHVGIATANFGAGEHQYAHTDHDMASVERTTDSAKVYAFMMLDYLT
jgi:hypothetical protein